MEITFTNTLHPVSLDLYKPIPASKVLPEWYKDLNSYLGNPKEPYDNISNATIKKCLPVFDSMSAGYIIPTYVDIFVYQKPESITNPETNETYETSETFAHYSWPQHTPIQFHNVIQAPTHPDRNGHALYPKWINPWSIKTPKGYSCLFIPPLHHPNEYFSILPGLVDTDDYVTPVNFPFALKDVKFAGIIPAGTPMVQVIPIKRDSWKMTFGDDKIRKQAVNQELELRSVFYDAYKTMVRRKKEYK